MSEIRPQHPADKRRLVFSCAPGARDTVLRELGPYREHQIEIARALWSVQRRKDYYPDGCATIADWGRRFGLGKAESRRLSGLGRALAARPDLEALVRSGEVELEAAQAISKILGDPALIEAGEDWVRIAVSTPLAMLRRRVNFRVEEHRRARERAKTGRERDPGDEVVGLTLAARLKDRDKLDRAQVLASREADTWLSLGQTFGVVIDHYLDTFDPRRRKPGPRRVGDTSEIPGSRYVPEAVKRAVKARSGGQCEIPGCTHKVFRYLAHIEEHAEGGSREAENLLDLCWIHHLLFDAGVITLVSGNANHEPVFAVNGRIILSDGRYAPIGGPDPPPGEPALGESGPREPSPPGGRTPPKGNTSPKRSRSPSWNRSDVLILSTSLHARC